MARGFLYVYERIYKGETEMQTEFRKIPVNGKRTSVADQKRVRKIISDNTEVQPVDAADNSDNDIRTGETRCRWSSWWRPSAVMVGRGRLGRVCYPDKSKPKDKST